jgi:protein-L-isoaspartate(D-aspartate) O-methyltransferase
MPEKPYSPQVRQLLATIEADYLYCSRMTGLAAPGERTLFALAEVPREKFVSAAQRPFACDNRPLPIGSGQTISQPFIVALMTDLLRPQRTDRILEIGTGSGYQAAILSRLVQHVYSMEIIEELAEKAKARLFSLGYRNVTVGTGDGRLGWPEHAPYEGIIITATAGEIPPPLLAQLKPGGRVVAPVRRWETGEQLLLLEKDAAGAVSTREVLPVAFVPLTGGSGTEAER